MLLVWSEMAGEELVFVVMAVWDAIFSYCHVSAQKENPSHLIAWVLIGLICVCGWVCVTTVIVQLGALKLLFTEGQYTYGYIANYINTT